MILSYYVKQVLESFTSSIKSKEGGSGHFEKYTY